METRDRPVLAVLVLGFLVEYGFGTDIQALTPP